MNKIAEHSECSTKSRRNQYYAIFSANLVMLSHGCINGWFTTALPLLMSENTPLQSGPLTTQQVSWVGSINSIGSIIACFASGLATNSLGCKRILLFIAIPALVFWLTIIFHTSVTHLLCARFLVGLMYTGLESNVLLYVTEVADNNIRGKLGSVSRIVRGFGMLFAYIAGGYVEYSTIPYLFIGLPILFFINFVILPNTPQHLVKKGKYEEAKKSIMFYKGFNKDDANDLHESEKELVRLMSIHGTGDSGSAKSVRAEDFYTPAVLKAFGIGFVLTNLSLLCGNFTILTYAVAIFEKSGSPINPYNSTIILAICLISGTFFTTFLSDSMGRKVLMIISLIGCALGNAATAIYLYLDERGIDVSAYGFVPVVSLSSVIFCSSFGICPLALICIVESFPTKVRAIGLIICILNLNFATFYTTKLFPILTEMIHMYGSISIFGVASTFGVIFISIVLKETKGKDLDTI